MNGIIIIDKPQGLTSFSVVSRIKKFTNTKRVGHAGTLDPLATGVLPILVGKSAVMQERLSDHDKSYRAGIRFGYSTDTGDITGKITLQNNSFNITKEDFCLALSKFVGNQQQIPPMYSAIQVDGQRLYDLARKGISIERKARDIEIYSAEFVEQASKNDFIFDVACSKGTYIRTLCEDIGRALGVPACMFSLQRTSCGKFSLDDATRLEDIENLYLQGNQKGIEALLISAETLFSDLPEVILPEFYSKLCLNGCEIYLSKLKNVPLIGENGVRIYSNKREFIGVAQVQQFEKGAALKVKYRFT